MVWRTDKKHFLPLSDITFVIFSLQESQKQLTQEALPSTNIHSETSQGTVVPDGKFSIMEFALLYLLSL